MIHSPCFRPMLQDSTTGPSLFPPRRTGHASSHDPRPANLDRASHRSNGRGSATGVCLSRGRPVARGNRGDWPSDWLERLCAEPGSLLHLQLSQFFAILPAANAPEENDDYASGRGSGGLLTKQLKIHASSRKPVVRAFFFSLLLVPPSPPIPRIARVPLCACARCFPLATVSNLPLPGPFQHHLDSERLRSDLLLQPPAGTFAFRLLFC